MIERLMTRLEEWLARHNMPIHLIDEAPLRGRAGDAPSHFSHMSGAMYRCACGEPAPCRQHQPAAWAAANRGRKGAR